MNELLKKLKAKTKIKEASILSESKLLHNRKPVVTNIPALNIALGGSIFEGLHSGSTMIAGPSRHFKSLLGLLMVKAYMEEHPDAVCIFYDSEFGSPLDYFRMMNIDMDRVLHIPITDIEEWKFDIIQKLKGADGISEEEKAIVFVDSIGNLASKKEVEDAENEKSVADMTRAKALKSLFRMVTPYLTLRDVPMVSVNHTYKEQSMHPREIVGGGTGGMLSSDTVWIIGRSQDKKANDPDLKGYNFTINVEKSRFVREKSKIPITVNFEGGLDRFTGLMDLALESGHIQQSGAWYTRPGVPDDKKWRRDETKNNGEFWKPILADESFDAFIRGKYRLSEGELIKDEDVAEWVEQALERVEEEE